MVTGKPSLSDNSQLLILIRVRLCAACKMAEPTKGGRPERLGRLAPYPSETESRGGKERRELNWYKVSGLEIKVLFTINRDKKSKFWVQDEFGPRYASELVSLVII